MNANQVYSSVRAELSALPKQELLDAAIRDYGLEYFDVGNSTDEEVIEMCTMIEVQNYVQ